MGKRRGKQTYYYLVESARVQGKPRIVSQQYLGSAEEVMAKLSETPAGQPIRSQHKQFGDLAAVWSMLARLDVAGIVDDVAPRYANAAASVGTYLALACANRIVDPCSKRGFADWWATTAGPRWVKLDRAALDHRRFWDAMDRLGQTELREIETRLGRRMVTEFGLDLTGLALDMTNFATFIDTGNDRAPIAQRGKAKQKRTDLRLVGLALVVTRDGGVPVISHAYPGDRPDVTQFPAVVDELLTRYRLQDPGARVLLRARSGRRPPNAPPDRPRRAAPVGTRIPRRTLRHPRDRVDLPRRQQGTAPRAAHAHRHQPNPTATRRPVRNPPIRAHPLTNSAQHSELGNTPALPKNTTPPGQIRPSINEGRKLPLEHSGLLSLDHRVQPVSGV
nr:hypothetical protein [Mycobacterium intracellulare]